MIRIALLIFTFCLTLMIQLAGQAIVINEVQASNSSFLDEDGDTPDWIELRNSSASTVNLQDWYLSDNRDDLSKWNFSDLSLNANDYLLIWASKKDRKELSFAQAIITEGDEFKYLVPNSALPNEWNTLAYNDAAWNEGPSGFGYGDNDDNTVLPAGTISVYVRKKFSITDINKINNLLFNIDYDDGYVAYINGVEISRENITGDNPAYNQVAIDYVEPQIINGIKPETVTINNFESILENGENVLAIQMHNNSDVSSDLTLIPFLSSLSAEDILPNPIPFLDINDSALHTNFKISSSSETIYLSDPNLEIIDSLVIENMPSGLSYGLNASGELVYFQSPTPGSANSGIELEGIINETIIFSSLGGPTSNFTLSLSGVSSPSFIRYTVNGSEPDASSSIYTNPFPITQNTVVRARIYRQNYFPSPIQTETYLVNTSHELPIISLVTDESNLFDDDTGIYSFGDSYEANYPYFGANFWQDWEKPIHFTLLEEDGTRFSFDGGIKIFGGWSRANDQRSFSLFARSQYGPSEIDFPLFKDNPYDEYQAFIMRNSGNDWLSTMMRDGTLTGLMRNSIVETQAFRPCVAYINGQFWGLYNMREKVNEHFLASRHNIDPDDVDLVELNSIPIHGSADDYNDLIDFANSTNFANDANYDMISDLVDIDNIIMYYLAQIYFDNTDWPGNNIKYWKEEGGKWKWVLFDTDFGFGRWNYFGFQNNTLAHALQANGPNWPNPPWSTLLFRRLNQNENFRIQFINQYADEMNTRFLAENVHAHIEFIRDLIGPEIPGQFQRWGASSNNWNDVVEDMKDFASQRSAFCREHVLDIYNLPDFHQIQILNTEVAHGSVQLNSIRIEESSWNGFYFENIPIKLTAVPRPGYQFVKWEGTISSTSETLTINMIDAMQMRPIWEVDNDYEFGIVINEISYNSSPDNDSKDWIELFNAGDETIDLSNWTFKDDDDTHGYIIPEGTILPSNDFLVISSDLATFSSIYPDVVNVVGDFDFGLGSTSDQIRIYNTQNIIQDSVAYLSIDPWPTTPNGEGPTLELINPYFDNLIPQNWKHINDIGSPGEANQEILSTEPVVVASDLKISPNPATNQIFFELNVPESEFYKVNIIDTSGKLIMKVHDNYLSSSTSNEFKIDISNLAQGVYYIHISDINGKIISEIFEKI